jgi:hypothetical protein
MSDNVERRFETDIRTYIHQGKILLIYIHCGTDCGYFLTFIIAIIIISIAALSYSVIHLEFV